MSHNGHHSSLGMHDQNQNSGKSNGMWVNNNNSSSMMNNHWMMTNTNNSVHNINAMPGGHNNNHELADSYNQIGNMMQNVNMNIGGMDQMGNINNNLGQLNHQ